MLNDRCIPGLGAWALLIVLFLALTGCATPENGGEGSVVANAQDNPPRLDLNQPIPDANLPLPVLTPAQTAGTVPDSRDPSGVPEAVETTGAIAESRDPVSTVAPVGPRGIMANSLDPAASASPQASPEPIQVSKEVFNQTFSDVDVLIRNLNTLIKDRNFSRWTEYLSQEYLNKISQPEYLLQLSQSAMLQKNNIVLKNLGDYFINVVVPSRANLRLDDLVFLSETVVEAIMIVGNRRVTVYRLIKIDNQWMIGLS